MQLITQIVRHFQSRARERRAQIFRNCFSLNANTRILDVGSEDGSNIAALLGGSSIRASNVHIADISAAAIKRGSELYGFRPVLIPESGRLPFDRHHFDIVYCSSVIEHVTVPKAMIWSMRDGAAFRARSCMRQQQFACEIQRLGKHYFVQTPCRSFPVESHSWLPFVGYLPRRLLVPFLGFSNRFWPKKTAPDWNLLSTSEMRELFPNCEIVEERFCGMIKSIMAIKR